MWAHFYFGFYYCAIMNVVACHIICLSIPKSSMETHQWTIISHVQSFFFLVFADPSNLFICRKKYFFPFSHAKVFFTNHKCPRHITVSYWSLLMRRRESTKKKKTLNTTYKQTHLKLRKLWLFSIDFSLLYFVHFAFQFYARAQFWFLSVSVVVT